jgi:CBS domain-containing protein
MPSVKQILAAKPPGVRTVDASFTVHAAVALLAAYDIGALVVTEGGRPVGIFSERDFVRKGVIRGRRAHETLVREVMSAPLLTVSLEHTLEDCMELMTARRIRHLPVLEGEELVGIVTIGDVVMQVIEAQRSTIEQLEGYITGKF